MERLLFVYSANELVGTLKKTDEGYEFCYLEGATQAISLTLPLRKEPYTSPTLFPFFDNLIPEGWALEEGITFHALDRKDRFGLLAHLCQDCIGRCSIRREL